ncbi:MAG: hypothetical protein ACKVQC_08185 [Elusimicrobiota bacterium]
MLEIDAASGGIVGKWSAQENQVSGEDKMNAALKKIEDAKKKRVHLFEQKQDEMKDHKKKLENVFQSEVEKVKKEGISEKPLRPFDLD